MWKDTFEWKREFISQLTSLLQSVQVHKVNLDAWIWLDRPSGIYSTYFSRFNEDKLEKLNSILSEVWKLKIPKKVGFLICREMRDRLPTKDSLRSRESLWNNLMRYVLCVIINVRH